MPLYMLVGTLTMRFNPFLHYSLTSKAQNPKIMRGTPYQNYDFMLAKDLLNLLTKFRKNLWTLNTNFYDVAGKLSIKFNYSSSNHHVFL